MNKNQRPGVAQCAAFIDERCYANFDDPLHRSAVPHLTRMALLHSGIPWDLYELSDFHEVADRYRVVGFIVPAPTDGVRAAQEWCDNHGVPYLEFAEGHCSDDPRPVRDFCKEHGLHCYNEDGHAIYVSRNLLAVHGAADGMTCLNLPTLRKVTPLFPPGEPQVASEIKVMVQAGETQVFRLDDG